MGPHIGEVLITRRNVRIGHEVFPIHNIAHIQMLHFVRKPNLSGGHVVLVVLSCLLAVMGIGAAGSREEATAGILLTLGGVTFVGTLIHGASRRVHEFILSIETSGGHATALSSPQYAAVLQVEQCLVEAIENPPASGERRVTITNIEVKGNSYDLRGARGVQTGDGNMQKNLWAGPPSANQHR
jgi:hypothetical protein